MAGRGPSACTSPPGLHLSRTFKFFNMSSLLEDVLYGALTQGVNRWAESPPRCAELLHLSSLSHMVANPSLSSRQQHVLCDECGHRPLLPIPDRLGGPLLRGRVTTLPACPVPPLSQRRARRVVQLVSVEAYSDAHQCLHAWKIPRSQVHGQRRAHELGGPAERARTR